MKKLLAIILTLITVFSCFGVCANAQNQGLTVKFGGTDVEDQNSVQAVSWWEAENGNFYFFVPSCWDANELKLWCTGAGDVFLNGTKVENGETYDLGETGAFTCANKNYNYVVIADEEAGSVFITTESGSLDAIHADKEYREEGKIAVYNEDGDKEHSGDLDQIKGRGNATWENIKKPYNIKTAKKASLFGMKKSKKWSLLANYNENTKMRNAMVLGAGADSGLAYTPEYYPVSLFINGNYMGAYLLTSRVEADENRVDVEDLDDVNEDICIDKYGEDVDMDTISRGGNIGTWGGLLEGHYKYVDIPETEDSTTVGGYIVELELANRYFGEVSGFVTSRSQPATMKSPEYASKAQMEFIFDYFQRFEDAVFANNGKNSKGEHYTDLADLTSLVKYYLVSEWASNMDSGLTSTYFYLDSSKDGKLYAGPLWDYDIALGNNGIIRYGLDYKNPEIWTVRYARQYRNTVFGRWDVCEKPTIYNQLNKHGDFHEKSSNVWRNELSAVMNEWATTKFDEYATKVKTSTIMDSVRWNVYGTYDLAEIERLVAADVANLKTFVTKRNAFIDGNISVYEERIEKTNFIIKLDKKFLTGINDIFEKFYVLFKLHTKIK